MKQIKYFYLTNCPYCLKANKWMEELKSENPDYEALNIQWIHDSKQRSEAAKYNYYYVPTFFIDNKKLHEGVASKEIIKQVFDAALRDV